MILLIIPYLTIKTKVTEEIRPKYVQSHRVERISLDLGVQPFPVWDTHLIEQTKEAIRAGCVRTCFCFVKGLRLVVLQIRGSRVRGCICILGLGPVYLREILSPFLCVCACMRTEARGGFQVFLLLCVCVCVVCVYVHACVWKPEVDFSSAFVISVLFLRQDLSSNPECTSLARPAGQQARGFCSTAL